MAGRVPVADQAVQRQHDLGTPVDSGPPRLLWVAAACVLYLVVALVLQRTLGGGALEFGRHPDEGAHYITGLVVRDYVLSGEWASPLAYALRYYAHYPAIAIGNWPPVFYGLEGPWLMVFGASRIAALVLVALTASALATVVFATTGRRHEWPVALAAGVFLLCLSTVRQQSALVSPELLLGALMAIAAVAFASLVEKPTHRRGLIAGVVSGIAMLVKGNAFALGLVPPLLMGLDRRWSLLRTSALWLAGAIAIDLVFPWYALTMEYARGGWSDSFGLEFSSRAVLYYADMVLRLFGLPLVAVMAVGLVRIVRGWGALPWSWKGIFSLGLASLAFHVVIPASLEDRFMISALPALTLLVVEGVRAICDRLPTLRLVSRGAVTAVVLVGATALVGARGPRMESTGIGLAASAALRIAGESPSAVLVSSTQSQEVAFVAEFAMRETRRPRHYVLRAVKVLASSNWSGQEYQQTVTTVEGVRARLDSIRVSAVVIDTMSGGSPFGHHALLRRSIESDTATWERVPVDSAAARPRSRFLVYRRLGPPLGPPAVEVEVKGTKVRG